MPLSRRSFLWNSLETAAAASTLGQLPQVAFGRTLSAARETARPILLDSNENAYGPSAKVQTAMHTALRLANRYPIEAHHSLLEQIAAFHRVSPEQVMVGCGSTEILRMCAFAFL